MIVFMVSCVTSFGKTYWAVCSSSGVTPYSNVFALLSVETGDKSSKYAIGGQFHV